MNEPDEMDELDLKAGGGVFVGKENKKKGKKEIGRFEDEKYEKRILKKKQVCVVWLFNISRVILIFLYL
jgi:hypothetical protein